MFLTSLAFAGGFFPTSATWETPQSAHETNHVCCFNLASRSPQAVATSSGRRALPAIECPCRAPSQDSLQQGILTPSLPNVPAVIISVLAGKEKRTTLSDHSPPAFSTVSGGWLGGCRPALRYYCAWLRLSCSSTQTISTEHRDEQ